MRIKHIPKSARINFLPASLIPFMFGSAYAFKMGHRLIFHRFALGFIGIACAHLAGNLFNDFFDYKTGVDNLNVRKSPFFGGSRAIQEGICGPLDIVKLAILFSVIAIACGLALIIITADIELFFIMIISGILAFEYTAPPLRLSYNRLGEAAIFLLFGMLTTIAGFYLFSGKLTFTLFLISLPLAFLILAVILCNEIPDLETDLKADKKNIISLCGAENGYIVYGISVLVSLLTLTIATAMGALPGIMGFAAVFYAIGIIVAVKLKHGYRDLRTSIHASAMTVAMHFLVGVSMISIMLLKK